MSLLLLGTKEHLLRILSSFLSCIFFFYSNCVSQPQLLFSWSDIQATKIHLSCSPFYFNLNFILSLSTFISNRSCRFECFSSFLCISINEISVIKKTKSRYFNFFADFSLFWQHYLLIDVDIFLFYVPYSLRSLAIMALHPILSFIAPKKLCKFYLS